MYLILRILRGLLIADFLDVQSKHQKTLKLLIFK